MRLLLLPAFLIMMAVGNAALGQSNLQIIQPEYPTAKVGNLWQATIINTSTEPRHVYLKGKIIDHSKGVIYEAVTQTFEVATGITPLANHPAVHSATVFHHPGFANKVGRGGILSAGNYTFCLEIFDSYEKRILEIQCKDNSGELIIPPNLVSPYNEENLVTDRPVFVWTPLISGAGAANTNYTVKIAERQKGASKESNITGNRLHFERSGINSPMLLYPAAAPELIENTEYVWTVTASYQGNEVYSYDIWTFTLKEKEEEEPGRRMYSRLKNSLDAGYLPVDDRKLRFIYSTKYEEDYFRYYIKDAKGEIYLSHIQEQLAKPIPGQNRYEIELGRQMRAGEHYVLEVHGRNNNISYIRFYINK